MEKNVDSPNRAFVVIADLDVQEGERIEKELGRCETVYVADCPLHH
jgi:hypothetical protein